MQDRARPGHRIAAALLAGSLAVVLLVGCSSSSPATTGPETSSPGTSSPATSSAAPSAADLVTTSATAMRAVTSAHFVLAITGSLPDLQVQSAEGDLTTAGDAKGKANIKQFGQLVEVEFIIKAKELYIKGATGGFTNVPAALANQVYDPTAILNPDKGVAKVLTSATKLSAVTAADGAYTLTGTVPKAVAAGLAPGITTDVVGTFTIDQASSRLSAVHFALTGSDSKPATVTLTLSNVNQAVAVTAPSGQ